MTIINDRHYALFNELAEGMGEEGGVILMEVFDDRLKRMQVAICTVFAVEADAEGHSMVGIVPVAVLCEGEPLDYLFPSHPTGWDDGEIYEQEFEDGGFDEDEE